MIPLFKVLAQEFSLLMKNLFLHINLIYANLEILYHTFNCKLFLKRNY